MASVRRTHSRAGLVGLLAVGVLATFTPQAAADAHSPWGYYGPVKGIKYKNRATIADSSRLYASTTAAKNGSGNVPSGYLGALARLYKGNTLCASNGYSYTSGPANSLSVPTLGKGCGKGTYHSYGVTKAYTGNGYKAVYTFKSPSVSHRSLAAGAAAPGGGAAPAWPKNAKGETYGSGLEATSPRNAPDLIRAYTTEGKIGYVKRAELEDERRPPRRARPSPSRSGWPVRTAASRCTTPKEQGARRLRGPPRPGERADPGALTPGPTGQEGSRAARAARLLRVRRPSQAGFRPGERRSVTNDPAVVSGAPGTVTAETVRKSARADSSPRRTVR
ncbi:hypothetical protein ACFQVA_33725 [Actinomadura keratinilytica]